MTTQQYPLEAREIARLVRFSAVSARCERAWRAYTNAEWTSDAGAQAATDELEHAWADRITAFPLTRAWAANVGRPNDGPVSVRVLPEHGVVEVTAGPQRPGSHIPTHMRVLLRPCNDNELADGWVLPEHEWHAILAATEREPTTDLARMLDNTVHSLHAIDTAIELALEASKVPWTCV